ncbi:hypothetical protein TNCV_3083161 [Trichonephila clavipes]|nr:hypothetical protein TNCV_3083161 [Trichonephila clavipes]
MGEELKNGDWLTVSKTRHGRPRKKRGFFWRWRRKAFPEPKRYSLLLSPFFFWQHGFLLVPSRPPPGHEFPHFSNVPSVTAGGFFKARHRGNPHNVLPGTVQGRSQGGFLDMKESPPPSHPQPSSSSSGTAFGRAFLGAVTDDARNSSAAYPSRKGSFPLPN